MLKVNLLITVATLALLEATNAKYSFGFCDQPTLQPNFDIKQYTGKWFEIKRDAATSYEVNADCVQARYSLLPDGSVLVNNTKYTFATK